MRNFSLNHHYDTALQLADHFDEQLKPFLYVLFKKLQDGHVCVRKNQIVSEISNSNLPEDIRSGFGSAVMPPQSKIIVACEGNLYLHRYYQYETSILEKIKSFLSRGYSIKRVIDMPDLKDQEGNLNWQSVAVLSSLLHSFTIITGGPGTGKTTTVARILRQLIAENPDIRIGLAAPTGKAAARMAESLQHAGLRMPDKLNSAGTPEPLTIHRLLGPVKGSIYFRHHATNPLPLDVLIVDECSMIDIALFSKLLDAVGENTRLILLGDRNQLASVEAGSLFGDLCDVAGKLNCFSEKMIREIEKAAGAATGISQKTNHPLSDHIIELQRSYRFSDQKGIGRLSHAIIQEKEDAVKDFFSIQDDEVMIETEYSTSVFESFVEGFEDYIHEPDILQALKKLNFCKVLCATREGIHGLHNTNRRIEKVLEEKKLIKRQGDFYEHRPVMITRNNYGFQLYNGDTGIVRKDKDGKLKVWFEIKNKAVGFAPSMISNCETAYAITIHKSQGSEFNKVLVILPDIDLPLLTKELVYTALARARKHVTLQSSEAILLSAVRKRVERGSGIKYRFK